VAPWQRNLTKLGIALRFRPVDFALYQQRLRSFDYDIITLAFQGTHNPGAEYADLFGSVAAKTPDSLKVAFKTAGGRTVYDGAGIDPDIVVEGTPMSKIAASLLNKNHVFNYATLYRAKNPTIASAKDFKLTDKEYQDFVTYLANKEYNYTTKSEELLKELETTSQDEKYYTAIAAELDKLKQSVKSDKNNDLNKHKEEIKKILEDEIVSRYYYSTGRILVSFNYDEDIKAALKVLNDAGSYKKILTAQK
jgi:carboxyl-terminal processing protease